MLQAVIGCDLSRAPIDSRKLPSGRTGQIANTPDASGVWLDTLDHDLRLVFKATRGCDGALTAALVVHHPFTGVNPRQAREFARATGTPAKTDRVDARDLARMGAALDLPATNAAQPSPLASRRLFPVPSQPVGRSVEGRGDVSGMGPV